MQLSSFMFSELRIQFKKRRKQFSFQTVLLPVLLLQKIWIYVFVIKYEQNRTLNKLLSVPPQNEFIQYHASLSDKFENELLRHQQK